MRRHELDPLSLVFGLMFTAAGVLFMSANLDFTDLRGEWLWPVPLVIIGVVMLVSALTRRDEDPEAQVAYSAERPHVTQPETAAPETSEPETSETKRDEAL